MWLDKLIKKQFISFYEDVSYKVLIEEVKNKKVISSTKKTFKEKKELVSFLKQKINENPQTYTATTLFSINQGVVPSCSKQEYLKREIDINNIKIACINNKYSFYASIYEINNLKREYKIDIDFIYSILAVIDARANERKDRLYVLVLNSYIVILAYENYVPLYSDIVVIEDASESELNIVEDIDVEHDIINDELGDIEDVDVEDEEVENTSKELEVLNAIKHSLKEYYEHYTNDFIEKIILLDGSGVDITLTHLIEDELLIPCDIEEFDLLKSINRLAIESI